jgi:hypothetical protein
MPLLTCPNDNVAMTPVKREGVEIDMCPQCRGVWLDRGELEKLLNVVRAADVDGPPRVSPRAAYGDREDDYREREKRRYGDDDDYRRKKRRFDLFDIFD